MVLAPWKKPGAGHQTWLYTLEELVALLLPETQWTVEFWVLESTKPLLLEDASEADHLVPVVLEAILSSKKPSSFRLQDHCLDDAASASEELEEAAHRPARIQRHAVEVPELPAIDEAEVGQIQRAAKGKTLELAPGLRVLYTYRQPNKRLPHGSFQCRCYAHDADQLINKNGRPYQLPCRKELKIVDGQALQTLQQLGQWALAAGSFSTRVAHQQYQVSSKTTSGHATAIATAKTKPAAGGKKCSSSSSSSSGSSSSSSSSSDNDDHAPASGTSPGATDKQVLLSGQIPAGRQSAVGLLDASMYALKDVPGDGDCLFHVTCMHILIWVLAVRCFKKSYVHVGVKASPSFSHLSLNLAPTFCFCGHDLPQRHWAASWKQNPSRLLG